MIGWYLSTSENHYYRTVGTFRKYGHFDIEKKYSQPMCGTCKDQWVEVFSQLGIELIVEQAEKEIKQCPECYEIEIKNVTKK